MEKRGAIWLAVYDRDKGGSSSKGAAWTLPHLGTAVSEAALEYVRSGRTVLLIVVPIVAMAFCGRRVVVRAPWSKDIPPEVRLAT